MKMFDSLVLQMYPILSLNFVGFYPHRSRMAFFSVFDLGFSLLTHAHYTVQYPLQNFEKQGSVLALNIEATRYLNSVVLVLKLFAVVVYTHTCIIINSSNLKIKLFKIILFNLKNIIKWFFWTRLWTYSYYENVMINLAKSLFSQIILKF